MNSEHTPTDLRLAPQFRTALVLLGTVLVSGNLFLGLQSSGDEPVSVVRSGESIGADPAITSDSAPATTAREETQREEILARPGPDTEPEAQEIARTAAPSTPARPVVSLEPTPTLMAAQTELERRRAAARATARIDTASSAQTTGEDPWLSLLERMSR